MSNPTYWEAQNWAFFHVKKANMPTYDIEYLLARQMNWSTSQLPLHYRDEMTAEDYKKFQKNINKFIEGYPPQYILGSSQFFGLDFRVNESVLIPRVETEDLVELILAKNKKDNLKVLDIGTGSGAIGLSLKSACPTWEMTLTDISVKALEVAKYNANALNLQVDFVQSDVYTSLDNQKYDIIVSNPPYIPHSEENLMDKSVLEHEPHLALFAADNGLAIYRKILQDAREHLRNNGKIYFEIGLNQGTALVKLAKLYLGDDIEVQIHQDLSEHDRMIEINL